MGLLICLVAYGFAFGASLYLAGIMASRLPGQANIVDPEGVGAVSIEVIGLIAAIATLSALFGARTHRQWLNAHPKSAAWQGALAGALTGGALVMFGVATTWAKGPIAQVAFLIARLTFVLWPAAIVSLVVWVAGDRGSRTRSNPAD